MSILLIIAAFWVGAVYGWTRHALHCQDNHHVCEKDNPINWKG